MKEPQSYHYQYQQQNTCKARVKPDKLILYKSAIPQSYIPKLTNSIASYHTKPDCGKIRLISQAIHVGGDILRYTVKELRGDTLEFD